MNTPYLSQVLEYQVKTWWARIRKHYPQLPNIIPGYSLNNRLKTTAGLAYCEEYRITVSSELFWQHTRQFCEDTIPHELAHLAAWYIFQDRGHGKGWYQVIETVNINTTRLHNMVNHKWETSKLRRMAK